MNINSHKKILDEIKIKSAHFVFVRTLIAMLILLLLIAIFAPWQQTAKGFGYIIAADPNNRAQNINATVLGRIEKWYVSDGSKVKKGDKLAEIVDNDPLILERLKSERDAKKRKYEITKIASDTANIDYKRQEDLFNQGLSSRKNFESAKIEYKKLLSASESALAELAESEVKLSRQERQTILAPNDGVILKVLAAHNSTIVKAGDVIATFAPNLKDPAIELYIDGNDIPLVYEGRKVRLQFEGWPAVQFSGWPSVAIGTFGGVVKSVDTSISSNHKFRIIITKDENEQWPDARFLRHGAKVHGFVLMNKVSLGYELWRQINGFPPEFDNENLDKDAK